MNPTADPAAGTAAAADPAVATILIVDDLTENRKYLATVLKHQGYRVLEAADGAQALLAVRADHPDLVITDVLMPVMDGYELVRQLRLDPATSTLPVVFYTAHYGEREARELALTSGVSWVLTKPAASAMVLEVAVRALSGRTAPLVPLDNSAVTTAFEREHLRLVTDKLAEKAGHLRTAQARLRALISVGLDLASEPDVDRLLQSVCSAARDLFGATYVMLGITNRKDGTVERFHTCGATAESARGAEDWIGAGDAVPGMLAAVVAERRTVRGQNPGGDPTGLRLPSLHPEVQSFLAVPVASPDNVYGWLCLVSNEGMSFSDDDERLVLALSGQVGRIYENGLFHSVAQQRTDEVEHDVITRRRVDGAESGEPDLAQRYLDATDAMLLAVDLEARIRMVNRYACAVLGCTAGELRGRDWIDTCVPVRMRDAVRQKFQNLLGGDLSIFQNPVLTKTGAERLIEWRNTLLRDEAGHITGAFCSGIDLTDAVR